jgi:adenine-specific DNA-methyltransferase
MDKLKLHTPDFTAANIDRIAALFPNCVTETKDESGKPKRAIDFDLLRQELSESLVDGPQERYRLDWPGKREALALANQPITKTLRPCREESVDFENTRNLYIEGDNLDALKLLQETYLGKVKMIYIDPPYNTGNDFIYDDNFSMNRSEYEELSGDRDEEGNAMFDAEKWKQNSSACGRFHSEWLSMIYPRLKLARNLLREDGVIFISIDEVEVSNLKKICDEVFGAENFVESFVWKKSYGGGPKEKYAVTLHESILLYARDLVSLPNFSLPYDPQKIDRYYKLKDSNFELRGPYRLKPLEATKSMDARPNLIYGVPNPDGGEIWPKRQWLWGKDRVLEALKNGEMQIIGKGDAATVNYKQYLRDEEGEERGEKPFSIIEGIYTQSGTEDLRSVFEGKVVVQFPKPIELLKKLLQIGSSHAATDIILDFFSGSATTAHAVMQLNAEDGGKRRHIMVQLPEPCDEKSEAFKAGYKTIAEIGKERIRRAGQKILQEWQAKQAKEQSAERDLLHPPSTIHDPPSPPDIGFRVLKIADSNFREIERTPEELDQKELALHTEHIKPDRTPEDLLFQVLVDWGVDLALPIVSETLHGKRVFFVDDSTEPTAHPALAACFDAGLSDELVHAIAARKPLRAVFRDDGFGNDSTRINVEQIFKLLSPNTEVKAL